MTSVATEPAPVLSIECYEPEGLVTRNVYPMTLTPRNLKTFWDKSRKFVTIFNEETRGDFRKFLEVFLREGVNGVEARGIFWVIDDFVGIMYLTDMQAGVDANVHYIFFDGRHKGRLELVRAMIAYVMERYDFHRLTAEAPLFYKPSALLFAEQIGFVKEGRKRLARPFDNKWFDVNVYGILKEEAMRWKDRAFMTEQENKKEFVRNQVARLHREFALGTSKRVYPNGA